ncbi:MAG: SDR family oxidoreductase [Pseudomonadota bacterium]
MTQHATFHDLEEKSVFITGGGSGIGAALTDGFLAQGAKVGFVQRSDAGAFADEMAAKHGNAPIFMPCDISDIDALKASMDEIADRNGPFDVIVNNAADDTRHSLADYSVADWDACMDVNLRPHFFTAQHAAPAMKAKGGGSIINFSSISYMLGNAGYPAYATSNAAITGLTRSLARELGPDGIRANALVPGWVLTQRQLDLWADPQALAAHMDKQCLKEHLAPEDIVAGTLFLASNTSRMMTGQVLVIDGGVVTTG